MNLTMIFQTDPKKLLSKVILFLSVYHNCIILRNQWKSTNRKSVDPKLTKMDRRWIIIIHSSVSSCLYNVKPCAIRPLTYPTSLEKGAKSFSYTGHCQPLGTNEISVIVCVTVKKKRMITLWTTLPKLRPIKLWQLFKQKKHTSLLSPHFLLV